MNPYSLWLAVTMHIINNGLLTAVDLLARQLFRQPRNLELRTFKNHLPLKRYPKEGRLLRWR